MCGVSGVFKPNDLVTRTDVEAIQRMNVAQKPRGPDGDGIWLDPHDQCVLGHTRLAIIDRSEAGRQPMSFGNDCPVLTYNGEVYNYRELTSDLESRGYVFRSKTDTEVLVHGYREWGIEGLVQKLRGMFAFALYDHYERTLYLVRDRLGIKPLYWQHIDGGVAFASTVKALLATGWPVTENPHALTSFIRWGSVTGLETTVKEISMVPPATLITINDKGQSQHRYWKIEDYLPLDFIDYPSPEAIRGMLEDTVSRHLQSDVPVGVFLSGGVDSSVLAKLSKCDGLNISFVGSYELDESEYAKQIGPCHHWYHGDMTLDTWWKEFIVAMDQPSIDGLNTFLVARLATLKGFPVALSGLGADELFAGYKHLQRSTWSPYWAYRSVFKPWQIRRMIDTDDLGFLNVANATHAEFTRYLHDQLLRDTDWASMAHGVEVRVPYLDHKLVEAILPVSMKLKCQSHKYLLIEAVKDLLPRVVWDRPKQGFELPFDRWLKQDAAHWQAMAMENSQLKINGIEWTWNRFLQGKLHWSRAWATVIASQWKQWI